MFWTPTHRILHSLRILRILMLCRHPAAAQRCLAMVVCSTLTDARRPSERDRGEGLETSMKRTKKCGNYPVVSGYLKGQFPDGLCGLLLGRAKPPRWISRIC